MIAKKELLECIKEAQASGARRSEACKIIARSLRTIQRWEKNPCDDGRKDNHFTVSNGLTHGEKQKIIEVACSAEFRDMSPNQIVPILAERGIFIGSESSFFRTLKEAGLLTHRSKAKVPDRKRPEEIIATGSNQVYTWDISYLLSFVRGVYFYLYLILDIWDRSIVGWEIHEKEDGKLAGDLLNSTCIQNGVERDKLTVHQDNGGPMVSGEFLSVLAQWGQASYSRPGVSDDNPFSESQFRTLKYRPNYPGSFETLGEVKAWIARYVEWYNKEHRHSGIGFVTPHQRRSGVDIQILEKRKETYLKAKELHPERWSGNIRKWDRPSEVALNPRNKKNSRQKIAA